MHAKTDSDVTSLAASSPTRSPPRRPVYYVQSPSRDSHDGEKTTMSFQSTPVLSPTGSPPQPQSVGRHSRESSASRFSGSLKPGSHKVSANGVSGTGRQKSQNPWKECDVIEEGFAENEEVERRRSRCYYFLAFVVGFFVLFSIFSLILWSVSKSMKPIITMKTITFEEVRIQAGSDSTGVATSLISMNSTVKFIYRDPATFFGVHVSSTPLDLSYTQITIASGTLKEFYQSRKSQRSVIVSVIGDKIPMYGSGDSLTTSPTGVPVLPGSVKLNFVIRSKAYVLGNLVKPKFYQKIDCSVNLDTKRLNVPISLKNSCSVE